MGRASKEKKDEVRTITISLSPELHERYTMYKNSLHISMSSIISLCLVIGEECISKMCSLIFDASMAIKDLTTEYALKTANPAQKQEILESLSAISDRIATRNQIVLNSIRRLQEKAQGVVEAPAIPPGPCTPSLEQLHTEFTADSSPAVPAVSPEAPEEPNDDLLNLIS